MELAFAIFLSLVILGSNRSEARTKKLHVDGRLNHKSRISPVVKKSTGRMKS